MISSLTNNTVKELVKLNTPKGRREAKRFIVEGEHLVREAKAAGVLLKAYTTNGSLDGEIVTDAVMKKICNTSSVVPQIGVCKMLPKSDVTDRVLILDGVQDPGNMGALMRSAKAFGFNTIFLCDGCVDIYNDKVIRSSQGAIFKLNFLYGDKLWFISTLKDYNVYGTNVVNGISVEEAEKKNKIALILGNEGNGISKEINNLGLKNIYIPLDNMESLNVSVAGGILMYEMSKK